MISTVVGLLLEVSIRISCGELLAATLATSTIGMSTINISAFAASTPSTSTDSVMAQNHNFEWRNITQVRVIYPEIVMNTTKPVTFCINQCNVGAAIVKLYKYGNATTIRSFSLPASYMPTQFVYVTLDAGTYYFTVQPQTGYNITSGSMYVKNIDGTTI